MKNTVEVGIGSRVEVYWPRDNTSYPGIITGVRKKRNIENEFKYHIQYDDGYDESIEPTINQVKVVSDEEYRKKQKLDTVRVKQLNINDKISVWWPLEKRFYPGILKDIRQSSIRPHHILYDDGDEELINLLYRNFIVIGKEDCKVSKSSTNFTVFSTNVDTKGIEGICNTFSEVTKNKDEEKTDKKSNQAATYKSCVMM